MNGKSNDIEIKIETGLFMVTPLVVVLCGLRAHSHLLIRTLNTTLLYIIDCYIHIINKNAYFSIKSTPHNRTVNLLAYFSRGYKICLIRIFFKIILQYDFKYDNSQNRVQGGQYRQNI